MAATPVPSSSNNQPNGWIWSARSLQNWELTLDTWAPKSISAVASCPSTITGASLECPPKWAMWSGLRKGTGATSGHPFFCATLCMVSFGSGFWRECWEPTVGCCGWCWCGWAAFPQFPQGWFKVFAGVAIPQVMWPHHQHLKHWRELMSLLFEVLPWLSLEPWEFPWVWPVVPVPCPADMLQAEAVCPRPFWPLWELAWPGVSCPSFLSNSLCVWGYFELCWGSCPVLLWSGPLSAWLSGFPTLQCPW